MHSCGNVRRVVGIQLGGELNEKWTMVAWGRVFRRLGRVMGG